jgi:hypothetical protein
MIYLIKCTADNTCKIGYSRNPNTRLSGVQTGNPNELNLEYVIDGNKKDEANLHEKFKDYRIRGEWFEYSVDIKEYFSNEKPSRDLSIDKYRKITFEVKSGEIEFKLRVLREFQEEYPQSHVGGSIGLMLHGIYLGRSLENSDLDMKCPKFEIGDYLCKGKSSGEDFDFTIFAENDKDYLDNIKNGTYDNTELPINYCLEIDIKLCNSKFDIIEFDRHSYNVSKLSTIMYHKTKYAKEGYMKHAQDINFVKEFKKKYGESKDRLLATL